MILEQLINAVYKQMREDYVDVYPQIYNKYNEYDFYTTYTIILKDLDGDFRIYQALKKDGHDIKVTKLTVDDNMFKAMRLKVAM